MEYTKNS